MKTTQKTLCRRKKLCYSATIFLSLASLMIADAAPGRGGVQEADPGGEKRVGCLYDQIPAVVDFSGKIDLNYDCLRSIAFELNLGTPFAEAIKDLNIINMNETNYKLTILFKDGYHASCVKRPNLFNGAQRIFFDAKLKDNFWTDFYINTEDIQYNPANGEQFIDGRKVDVVNPYDENEKDRYEAFEKDNGVVKVIIPRARERDIHCMV